MANIETQIQDYNINDVDIPAIMLNQAKMYLLQHNITKETLSSYVQESFHPVQNIAYSYLNNLVQYINKVQQIMKQRLDLEKARLKVKEVGSGYQYIYNQKKFKTLGLQLSQQSLNIVSQTQLFSEKMQQALGKKPMLAYVHLTKGHETDIYLIDDISKIVRLQSKTRGIYNPRLRATLKGLNQYGKAVNKLQYMSERQLQYLDSTYLTVLHRFNKFIYNHTPRHLILWNMNSNSKPKWYGMWMQQRGDIVQSYQRAVFTRYQVFHGSKIPPQYDIDKFMQLVKKVDSVSGLLQGDIETKNGLSISSKALGAEPQGIKQAINLAVQLINLSDNSHDKIIEYLKNKQQELVKKADGQGIRNSVTEITKEEFEKLMTGRRSVK